MLGGRDMTQKILADVDIKPFLKAFRTFQRFLAHSNTDQEKSGTIKSFEFCYELVWKVMKKVLLKKGLETASPRDTFRVAAANQLIDDIDVWFEFIEKRNLTVHTYNLETMEEVFQILPIFEKKLEHFIQHVKKLS